MVRSRPASHEAFLRRWEVAAPGFHNKSLNTSAHELVKKGFQNGLVYGTDPVPDDHPWDELVSHSLMGPLISTPTEEGVICLSFHIPGSHLFSQSVSGSEDQGISGAEDLDRSCCFTASAATIQIAELVLLKRVIATWCNAWRRIVVCHPAFLFREICSMLLRHVWLLTFVSPSSWFD